MSVGASVRMSGCLSVLACAWVCVCACAERMVQCYHVTYAVLRSSFVPLWVACLI